MDLEIGVAEGVGGMFVLLTGDKLGGGTAAPALIIKCISRCDALLVASTSCNRFQLACSLYSVNSTRFLISR